jgi:predicted Zn finger-like uncharacterized protein
MFITCQECNTTFRLDERLLKPSGSKVRCSQCRYTFVATPPIAKPMARVEAKEPVFEAVAEEAPGPAVVEEPEDRGLEGIDLAELDSILESETAAAAPEEEMKDQSEIEVDLPLDEEEDELDEIDLDFDFDAALEAEDKEKSEPSARGAGKEPSDELSLDMDFEIHDDTLIIKKEEVEGLELATLTLDEEPAPKPVKAPTKAARSSEPSLEDDLDMAFKDLDLGGDDKIVKKPEAAKGKTEKSDNLDLLDFDLDLEGETTSDEHEGEEVELSLSDETESELTKTSANEKPVVREKKEATGEDDLGLDLDLGELDFEAPAPGPAAKAEKVSAKPLDEELDFDLDLDESTAAEPSSKKAASEEENEELSLDLDSDFEMDTEKKEAIASADDKGVGEDLEELTFEMDMDLDEKPAAKAKTNAKAEVAEAETAQDEGDIDLSDIEQMLEGDASAVEKVKPAVVTEKAKSLSIDDEIDLQEIESAIEKADDVVDSNLDMEEPELELDLGKTEALTAAAAPPSAEVSDKGQVAAEPLDLDLDLELELEGEAPAEAAKAPQTDQVEGELDLSDLAVSDMGEGKPAMSKAETVHTGDIELDFQIEEEERPSVSTKTTLGKTTTRIAEIPIEQTIETEPVEPKIAKRPKPAGPKKKSSKIGVILLLLLLLAAAVGGIYYAVMYMGIEIPYVSEYLKPKPKDPAGTANLTTMDINSKFIENSQSGRLFIITGKVRNGYGMRRNTIRLQGKLFTKGKVLVKTEFSYAGVQISDQELATLSIAEIKQALNATPAALDATGNVQPGQTLPFIVVFSDLPSAEQLDEFAVELISSLPGQ